MQRTILAWAPRRRAHSSCEYARIRNAVPPEKLSDRLHVVRLFSRTYNEFYSPALSSRNLKTGFWRQSQKLTVVAPAGRLFSMSCAQNHLVLLDTCPEAEDRHGNRPARLLRRRLRRGVTRNWLSCRNPSGFARALAHTVLSGSRVESHIHASSCVSLAIRTEVQFW